MENRIYQEKFEELRKNIFGVLKSKNEKVFDYEKKAVDSYLDNLFKGDFSTKSLKSKVAYFINQKEKYENEIDSSISDSWKKMKDYLEDVFLELENEIESNYIQKRRNDLLERNASVKHKRQDNANKMSAIDKEFQGKVKDSLGLLSDSEKAYSSFVTDANKSLNIEIQKVIEGYNKKSSQLEKNLLVTDEKNKIKEIKANIKELREQRLLDEFNTKTKYINESNLSTIQFLTNIKEARINQESVNNDYNIKKIENSKSNDFLSLESETNIFNYDLEKKIEGTEKISKLYNKKIEYLNLVRDQKKNIYSRTVTLKKKYYDKAFLYVSYNPNHPFIDFIDYLLAEFDVYSEYFNTIFDNLNNERGEYLKKASEYIMNMDVSLFKGKARDRRDLDDSVRKCINSIYDSDIINIEYGLVIDLFDRFINQFNIKNIELEKKDELLNNIYVYDKSINRNDMKEKFIEDLNYLDSQYNKFINNFNNQVNRSKEDFISIIKNKEVAIENSFNEKINKQNSLYQEKVNKINTQFEQDVEKFEKESAKKLVLEAKEYKMRVSTL